MNEITMEELEEVIRTTKKNKAPGLSGITYDFWKHSKSLMRILLLEIINESMKKEKVLEDWKKGMVYPITWSFWNQDLNLTSAITLIEIAIKIFLKILVRRLSDILSKEKVLMDTNYAALKNESTFIPSKIK